MNACRGSCGQGDKPCAHPHLCRTETQQVEDDMPDLALALLITTVAATLGLLAAGFVLGL